MEFLLPYTVEIAASSQSTKLQGTFEAEDYIRIIVEDEGPGIPEDKLDQIFQRYYQIEHNSTTGIYNWGTGIGLYFARRLAELHKGYIIAGNRNVGSGAVFTIIIPINKTSSNLIKDSEGQLINKDMNIPDLKCINEQRDEEKYTILIIDDDLEISAYIQAILKEEYNAFSKDSADRALSSLEEIQPDLILCDVVMPGISGYDFCRKLKSNNITSHIPVVLLTAKSSLNEQIEGLDTGANAYILKPFDPDYLLAVIKSQLLNLQNTRDLLANSTNIPKVENILSEVDNKFMNSLYSLMESELDNPEINISYMSKEMGMSRTKFYLKIKGLTGESPNILFRRYKLNRALELIESGNYNITEIADMTGFSTLSHFSVSFKKQFGINPSEYKENKN